MVIENRSLAAGGKQRLITGNHAGKLGYVHGKGGLRLKDRGHIGSGGPVRAGQVAVHAGNAAGKAHQYALAQLFKGVHHRKTGTRRVPVRKYMPDQQYVILLFQPLSQLLNRYSRCHCSDSPSEAG